MSISNEMAKYWAEEDAEANDRPPQRVEGNTIAGKVGVSFTPTSSAALEAIMAAWKNDVRLRFPEGIDTPFEEATPLLDAHLAEEAAKQQALFDKLEALETAWTDLGAQIKGPHGADAKGPTARMHLLLGGAIEALKELAYATKGGGR